MPTILFIHGTGVREPSFSRTFRVVKAKIATLNSSWNVKPCYWGGKYGVQVEQIRTVPPGRTELEGTTRSISDAATDEELTLTIWQMLYADPLFELRWISGAPREANSQAELRAPGEATIGTRIRKQLARLSATPEIVAKLRELALVDDLSDDPFEPAVESVRTSDELRDALATDNAELPSAVSRAIVASIVVMTAADGAPVPDATQRNDLQELIQQQLGGTPRGVMSWLLAPLAGFAARGATTYVTNHRSGISGEAAPAAGDVMLYQTRGDAIRKCISDAAVEVKEPVYLLAHSLGGIASVDLMAMSQPANVRGLITVASQAPLLYEFDALTSMRNPGKLPGTLPDHFPKWLNIFDPRDFLSYMAEPVFGSTKVKDAEIRSGQPFPQSHSAYWNRDLVWTHIKTFIDNIESDYRARNQ